jgi:FMN-dependent NADH-azoreductase
MPEPEASTNGRPRVTAILGTYRKGGVVDSAVEEILAAAREHGADTSKIYLIDKQIAFCTNCRHCTQEPGAGRGQCAVDDDMACILDEIARSQAIVLASPMNFFTVTAVMKRFIERLVCFAYWPWGKAAPTMREMAKDKRAVIVGASAAPSLVARLMTGMIGLMKKIARLLGAKKVDVLCIGLAARQEHQPLSERIKKKARKLGEKLVR